MRRLDEQFAINPNDPVLPTWRRAMAAIEGRLRELEDQRADYEEAIRRFEELALARINEVLLPALEQITAAATLGFLLARSSTEGSLIADERIQFVVEEGPQRDLFTPTPFVAVQRSSTTDDFAVGYVEAYDRASGYLLVKILTAYGSPGPFDDWVISAAPGVSEATRSYWERALVAAQGAERDAAQTGEDRRYVEAAREALEEAGLNPDQYVWRDGTRPFTAVITGVAPDATADNATMPTAFWTRRRVQEGVASLQAGAPATLNNFVRVAAALGNDPNFAATLRRELNVMAVPIGGIIGWADETLPANFMLCDGAVYNVVDAPLLAAKLRARHGGDGLATFGVPNLLDRTIVGAGHSWGLAAAGGAISHVLTVNEMPHHAHGVSDPQHSTASVILATPTACTIRTTAMAMAPTPHPVPGSSAFVGRLRPPEPAAQSRRASRWLPWRPRRRSRRRHRGMDRRRGDRPKRSPSPSPASRSMARAISGRTTTCRRSWRFSSS